MLLCRTARFARRNLPHLEVQGGRYFITVRCADSLPLDALLRLEEVHSSVQSIQPRSVEFAAMQRAYFRTMEKYLDFNAGSCTLRRPEAAAAVISALESLKEWDVRVPHYSVMPNHWHALLAPADRCARSLSEIMKRVKGRSAKVIRRFCGGDGAVWQREWFDRWVRDEAEWARIVEYIHNNPVRGGLARDWREHPWTR